MSFCAAKDWCNDFVRDSDQHLAPQHHHGIPLQNHRSPLPSHLSSPPREESGLRKIVFGCDRLEQAVI
jgi:hypothetical protein